MTNMLHDQFVPATYRGSLLNVLCRRTVFVFLLIFGPAAGIFAFDFLVNGMGSIATNPTPSVLADARTIGMACTELTIIPYALLGLWIAGRQGAVSTRGGLIRLIIYTSALFYGHAMLFNAGDYLWGYLQTGQTERSGIFVWPLFSPQQHWSWEVIVTDLSFLWWFLPLFVLTKTTLVDRANIPIAKSPSVALWLVWISLGAVIVSSLEWPQNLNPIFDDQTREDRIWSFLWQQCDTAFSTVFFFAIVFATTKRLRWLPLVLLLAIPLLTSLEIGLDAIQQLVDGKPYDFNLKSIIDPGFASICKLTVFCAIVLCTRLSGLVCVRAPRDRK